MPPQTGYSYFLENALKYGWAVPQGVIMMWSGQVSAIPTGYVFCNGANNTPDLRDKFVVGAYQDDDFIAKTNVTGSLTQSGGSADHNHGFYGDGHAHAYGAILEVGSGSIEVWDAAYDSSDDYATGTTDNQNTFPVPYFALAYIMKT